MLINSFVSDSFQEFKQKILSLENNFNRNAMKTIKLQVNNEIYDHLISILNQFNSKDLKVLNETSFDEEKQYLENQLKELDKENSKYITIDELDSILEETIEKYEH